MKNNIIFGCIFIIFICYGFLNIEKDITFSEYADVRIPVETVNLGKIEANKFKTTSFQIENISNNTLIILNIIPDNGIQILKANKNVLVLPKKKINIDLKCLIKTVGKFSKTVKIESNASRGLIIVKIIGFSTKN